MTLLVESRADARSLERSIEELWSLARSHDLDPFPTHFELVPAAIMYEFGAYGLPGRFSHWTHGRTYQQIKTMYDYGLSKIYELVINANPAYAFLLENNTVLQNVVVAAHVLAHVDFFHHNAYFARTDRQMLDTAAVHAARVRQYAFEHGSEQVEQFLDAVLAIQDHVDTRLHIPDEPPRARKKPKRPSVPETPYDDLFYVGAQRRSHAGEAPAKGESEPRDDLLLFLAEHADALEDWQRDVLHMVRTEQRYFVPQMQTKVMNEGWAAYWHARLVRELDLSSQELIEFSRMHAGVLESSRRAINPYHVGMRIFEAIEQRWDEPDEELRERGGATGGQGKEKIFEVRALESDVSFLRNYLTEELVEDLDLYLYRREGDKWVIVEKDWQKVRDTLVATMTNFGRPTIVVQDGDYGRRGELYLKHCFEGQELDAPYADRTLEKLYQIWQRPVHVETVAGGKPTLRSFNGSQLDVKPL
ncbi:MAG TPA: SpoVR family protein [Myxococcales bacterium]|nr:SpoVR family protein [Myxococcales bacterium]